MMANWCRCCGRQSTLAPTSTSTAGVPRLVGKTEASAGRSTPGSVPSSILAAAMAAPVLPAETIPCALPSRTCRAVRRTEASGLRRSALTGLSSMAMTSLAGTMEMGRELAFWRARWRSSRAGWPGAPVPRPPRSRPPPAPRLRLRPGERGRSPWRQPQSWSWRGWSLAPPAPGLLRLHRHHRPPPVVAAVRAGAVGRLGLVAVGTLAERERGDEVVRAPLVLAGLRMTPFGVGHGILLFCTLYLVLCRGGLPAPGTLYPATPGPAKPPPQTVARTLLLGPPP